MVDNPSTRWVRFLRAKYKAGSDTIPLMKHFTNESFIWKSICKSWEHVLKGICWRIGDGDATHFWTHCWLKSGGILNDLVVQTLPEFKPSETVKDLSAGDGGWHLDRILPWLSDAHVAEVTTHMAGREDIGQDRLTWKFSADGNFSTKSAYESLRNFPATNGDNKWKQLWHWNGPTRAKYFPWLVIKGGLKTNCLRWECGVSDSATCPLCGASDETITHAIQDCVHVSNIWCPLLGNQMPPCHSNVPITTWLFENIASKVIHHSGIPWSLSLWIEGFVKWNLDGSVNAPHSMASSGCVLRDNLGRWLTGAVRNIGISSITIAELWAFKDATRISLLRGDSRVWFESDYITAVNFINRGVHPTHPCFGLVQSIRNDLAKLQKVRVSQTFQEGNFVADRLADLGHSFPLGCHIIHDPPSSI
ncbi:Ribonuclease H-like superfamily [Sesbania bispinosa]|nr:Ribonuclease H-like superfamily [Sesbania bispinosa]